LLDIQGGFIGILSWASKNEYWKSYGGKANIVFGSKLQAEEQANGSFKTFLN